MKRILPILSLLWLLHACTSQTSQTTAEVNNVANCPEPPTTLLEIKTAEQGDFYSRFDYQIRDIVADADTVRFKALNHDFVFCRGDKSWTIQPGTFTEENRADFENPAYKTIELNGKNYQYRVLLNPNLQEAQQVVFELITPNSQQPQQQTLYTLEQVQQANTGNRLGVPEITGALEYNNQLFWTVSPEQGEGNGGIATIVSYDPQTDKVAVIQPEEIKSQQITDLAIAGEQENPTFWLGTKIAGEGNPYIPSLGLVAYRPQSGSVDSYRVGNSPIVGAIPSQLLLEEDQLWVGTGNGICQVEWQAADNPNSWSCWRFALMSEVPSEGLPIYSTSLAQSPAVTLDPATKETVEVLWWSPKDLESDQGRYEIRSDEGFTVTLDDRGAIPWSEFYREQQQPPVWEPPVYWPGQEWHWEGDRFVRGFDEVSLSYFGGGPHGIESGQVDSPGQFNHNAIRGDLELLKLTKNSTSVKYYSGWVDESLLNPYISVVPQQQPQNPQPNPLKSVAEQLSP